MRSREDRDILLPECDRRRPRPRMPRVGWRRLRRPSRRRADPIGAGDLLCAFEYVAAESRERPGACEPFLNALAARMMVPRGQERFALQVRLAEVLARDRSVRFHVALRVATRLPVPQARMTLLELLTQPGLAHWRPTPEAGRAADWGPRDLRPLIIAALGQLRDPSLLSLFHRLLRKVADRTGPDGHLAAVIQWALMALGPSGRGQPVPRAMLVGQSAVLHARLSSGDSSR